MLDASHAIIGASLAKIIPNPYIGFPVSLISHFVADLCPHWDFMTRKTKRSKLNIVLISLMDAFIGFAIGYLIFRSTVPNWYLLSMMFTAQLPDWIEGPYHVFNFNFPPFSSVKKLQSKLHFKMNLPWGLVVQVVVVLLFISLALT